MIIVTGATGFVGRRFIRCLTERYPQEKIVCLTYEKADTELEKTGLENLGKFPVEIIPVDLISRRGMEKVPKSPRLVFHLASVTVTSQKDHSVNDIGALNLLKALAPLGRECHFIFTSSIATNDERADYSKPVNEDSVFPERPCHEYGRKKLLAERYFRRAAEESGFGLSIIKVCGVYGEGARKFGLFDMVNRLAQADSFLARMNWPGKIALTNVEDMARFLILVGERQPQPGTCELYIPAVESLTMAEMSRVFYEAMGKPYREIRLPDEFWNLCRFFARRKRIIEPLLHHKLYNTFWQACLLVNSEFWNESVRIGRIFPQWRPVSFKSFYTQKITSLPR